MFPAKFQKSMWIKREGRKKLSIEAAKSLVLFLGSSHMIKFESFRSLLDGQKLSNPRCQTSPIGIHKDRPCKQKKIMTARTPVRMICLTLCIHQRF